MFLHLENPKLTHGKRPSSLATHRITDFTNDKRHSTHQLNVIPWRFRVRQVFTMHSIQAYLCYKPRIKYAPVCAYLCVCVSVSNNQWLTIYQLVYTNLSIIVIAWFALRSILSQFSTSLFPYTQSFDLIH